MEYSYGIFYFCEDENREANQLVLTVPSEININQFQLNMILKNPLYGIVQIDYGSLNSVFQICYNINGKKSLCEHFESLKDLDDKEYLLKVLQTLYSITSVMILTKNIYLDFANFAIDEKLIFVDESNMSINLIYVPIYEGILINKMFIRMIENLFNGRTIKDIGINILDCIYNGLKDEFEPEIFRSIILKEMNKFEIFVEFKEASEFKASKEYNGIDGFDISQELKENSNEQESIRNKIQRGTSPPEIEGNINLNSEDNNWNLWRSKKVEVSILGIQLLLIAVFVIVHKMYLKGLDDWASIMGIAVVLGAIDLLIIRKITKKQKN